MDTLPIEIKNQIILYLSHPTADIITEEILLHNSILLKKAKNRDTFDFIDYYFKRRKTFSFYEFLVHHRTSRCPKCWEPFIGNGMRRAPLGGYCHDCFGIMYLEDNSGGYCHDGFGIMYLEDNSDGD